jgi:isopenicillin N synthase-like dioxygenase
MAKEPFVIPLVDFGGFLHGSEAERIQAARQLVKSFEAHGFVRLRNHGISKEFVNDIWRWVS